MVTKTKILAAILAALSSTALAAPGTDYGLDNLGDYANPRKIESKLDLLPESVETIAIKREEPKGPPPELTVDKKNGKITVRFPDAGLTYENPVLTGKVRSDALDLSVYNTDKPVNWITPAGEFEVTMLHSTRLNEPMLAFIIGKYKIAAIHPMWMGNPNQKRPKRLLSETPDDNNITNGCINVDPDFFYSVLIKVPDGAKLKILPEEK
jgi:hypothetical protein